MKDIRRATRKQYGAEEKIRIMLEGLRGEEIRSPRFAGVRASPRALLQLIEGIPRSRQEAAGQ